MALLSSFLSLSPAPPCPYLPLSSSSSSVRLQSVSVGLRPSFTHGFQTHAPVLSQRRGVVITMASADAQEPATEGGSEQSEDEEANIPLQNLPLESKLQLKLEQKMKMKIAKKIRLRRKRLVRKRMMRKKGRWPPSKMKKLKNV